jgi:hypothetical protein
MLVTYPLCSCSVNLFARLLFVSPMYLCLHLNLSHSIIDWLFGVGSRLYCDCKASLAELLRILVADGGGFNWTLDGILEEKNRGFKANTFIHF